MESERFFKTFTIRWADVDPNRHVRHSAYLDFADDVRLAYLSHHGYPPERFDNEGFGPVIFKEEARFSQEVLMGEEIRVDLRILDLSRTGRRWSVLHHVEKENGSVAAKLTLSGSWLDRQKRKLTRPPEKLVEVLRALPAADHAGGRRRRRG